LGSGVSRDAGIPTGWEVVGDLISKLASAQKLKPEPDPYTWYKNHFKEEPEYSTILEKLTTTLAERASLLKTYFEPTEEEREQGLKVPTLAHKSIAKLVKYGYIHVILTTNFDRLIEKSLEEENVTPAVISTDDTLEGALPYVHSKCTLVKVNGDYMDARIKNTPKELKTYSKKLNSLLDKIFDEFGLIICGWSGEWDIALRNAILRTENRRFPVYWLSKGEATEEAKRVIEHRQAEVIHIENANRFFTQLLEKVDSLREFERPHPLSYAVAKVTVKKYLSEEKYKIKLFDLVNGEIENVFSTLSSDKFNTQSPKFDKELCARRMHEYEETIKILAGMLTQITYFDEKRVNSQLIVRSIERLSKKPRTDGNVLLISLQHYPVLLLMYLAGVVSLEKQNWHVFRATLLDPVYTKNHKKRPILEYVNIPYVFEQYDLKKFIPRENAEREFTPVNNYVFELLYEHVQEFVPDRAKYEDLFDFFEFLLGLIYLHSVEFLYGYKASRESFEKIEAPWAPVGRFGWKYFRRYRDTKWESSPVYELLQDGLKQRENWGLLKEGFFDGSAEVFNLCYEKYLEFVTKASKK